MSESSGLPPEQDAVRRLLADARHDGPPPPDVVARLDETLASLVAERSAELTAEDTAGAATGHDDRSPGRVVDLGSRRRRRGEHRPAGRRLRRRRGRRDRPGSPPRRQRHRQRLELPGDSPTPRSPSRPAPRTTTVPVRAPRRVATPARSRSCSSPTPRRTSCSPDSRDVPRCSPTTTRTSSASCSSSDRTPRPVASASGRSLRSVAATASTRVLRPPWCQHRSTVSWGWSCSVAPSARHRASSSTCAARPFRCVRSRCPRPERCGRGVEQRSPTIG